MRPTGTGGGTHWRLCQCRFSGSRAWHSEYQLGTLASEGWSGHALAQAECIWATSNVGILMRTRSAWGFLCLNSYFGVLEFERWLEGTRSAGSLLLYKPDRSRRSGHHEGTRRIGVVRCGGDGDGGVRVSVGVKSLTLNLSLHIKTGSSQSLIHGRPRIQRGMLHPVAGEIYRSLKKTGSRCPTKLQVQVTAEVRFVFCRSKYHRSSSTTLLSRL